MGADGAWRLSQPDSSGRARKGQMSEHVVLARGSPRLELRGPGVQPGARGHLAALRILQPLPPASALPSAPLSYGQVRTRGSPLSFWVHVFPVSPGILSVWRSLLHYYSQWSVFLGSLDGAHLSVSFCLPLSRMLLPVRGWGGWSQSRAGGDAWARGLAREGRCGGLGQVVGSAGVEPASASWCPQHGRTVTVGREAEEDLSKWCTFSSPFPTQRRMKHGSFPYFLN